MAETGREDETLKMARLIQERRIDEVLEITDVEDLNFLLAVSQNFSTFNSASFDFNHTQPTSIEMTFTSQRPDQAPATAHSLAALPPAQPLHLPKRALDSPIHQEEHEQ